MASSFFTRLLNPRNLCTVNNGTVVVLSNLGQRSTVKSCLYSSESAAHIDNLLSEGESKKKIGKAMKVYLQRIRQHNEFMEKETALYEIGKRHLANMMGEHPETFTQDDVDKAIEYLFPSGLFEPRARPIMRPPKEIFPPQKVAQFDESGRPFHYMYYTLKPNYYELLANIARNLRELDAQEDLVLMKGHVPPENKVDTVMSEHLSKANLEDLLSHPLVDKEYDYYLASMQRLINHPLSNNAKEFILKYMKPRGHVSQMISTLPIEHDEKGREYITVNNCSRKSARGRVTIWTNGTGKITINGQDMSYFEDVLHQQQCFDNKEIQVNV